MIPSEIGKFVEENFKKIEQEINYLEIHEYVIMPNHIHFIAVINNQEEREPKFVNGLQPLIPHSISSFTNQFKGVIKKWCNKMVLKILNGNRDFTIE